MTLFGYFGAVQFYAVVLFYVVLAGAWFFNLPVLKKIEQAANAYTHTFIITTCLTLCWILPFAFFLIVKPEMVTASAYKMFAVGYLIPDVMIIFHLINAYRTKFILVK